MVDKDIRRHRVRELVPDEKFSMITVLLVDDHELIRTGVKGILDKAPDIEVAAEASTGEEAVDLVRKISVDVVLMDVNMPGMGGIEATRRVLRVNPKLKVIALTVLDDAPFPTRLHEVGAMGFLPVSYVTACTR